MASYKTKQPLEPSSSAAVGRANLKSARPVGFSRTRSKAATTQLDAVASGEEFCVQGNDGDDDSTDSEQDDGLGARHAPVLSKKTAFDVLHFFIFTIVEREKGKSSSNQEIPGPKICKLCSDIYGTDKSAVPRDVPNFIYGPKTANGNLRRHLNKVHAEEYDQAIKQHKWPYQLSSQTQTADASTAHSTRSQRDPRLPQFSQTVFQELLVRFIVADDQSIRVVECPEFRQLCMVLCQTLVDVDIPRRDKMREAVISQWRVTFELLKSNLSKSCGRISFTADVWSNANLESYLALTAHWLSYDESSRRLSLNAALIGFHRLRKRHTGANMAKNILHLLDRANVTLKIGHFTLDNAENNAVAMQELKTLLAKRDTAAAIDFDAVKHRIRCYAHIINICSSHIISSMTSVSKQYLSALEVPVDSTRMSHDDSEDELDDDSIDTSCDIDELELDGLYDDYGNPNLKEWFAGIKRDPLRRARRIIRLLRSSDQRRTGFRDFIKKGNDNGLFFRKDSTGKRCQVKVPELQLLRDVKTRWDSVYLMLERLRFLRPAINQYIETLDDDYSDWRLSELDWYILEGLETVLSIPHTCQQSMSSESTPVLSRAIASFEMFMTRWEKLGKDYERLRPWTEIGIKWATKYYIRMDDTDAYIITMFLNPTMRFSWIETQWDEHYIQRAKNAILNLMGRYQKQKSLTSGARTDDSPLPPAAVSSDKLAQTRFQVWEPTNKKKPTDNALSVKTEFQKYVLGSTSSETGILQFWEANKTEFPTLFSIAMDYLPIQATSVPCERVFSSAKDTDTAKRNRINPILMEALQMLKYSLKTDRLNFMDGWKTSDAAMGAVAPTGDLSSLFLKDGETALDKLLRELCINNDHEC